MSVFGDLLQACSGAPDWYHVSRQHWVMDLDWYKRVRREARAMTDPDPEPDEDKWVPSPHDTLFGYSIEVRENGGEPHLVSDNDEVTGRLLQAIFAAPERDGPPYTHTLKLPETEEEARAEMEAPLFTVEEDS